MKQSCLEILLLYYRHFVKKVKSRYNNTVIAPYLQVLFNSGFCRFAGGSPVFLAVWARPGGKRSGLSQCQTLCSTFPGLCRSAGRSTDNGGHFLVSFSWLHYGDRSFLLTNTKSRLMAMWGYPGLKDTAAKVPVSLLCFNPALSLKNLDNPHKTTYMLLCAAPDGGCFFYINRLEP